LNKELIRNEEKKEPFGCFQGEGSFGSDPGRINAFGIGKVVWRPRQPDQPVEA